MGFIPKHIEVERAYALGRHIFVLGLDGPVSLLLTGRRWFVAVLDIPWSLRGILVGFDLVRLTSPGTLDTDGRPFLAITTTNFESGGSTCANDGWIYLFLPELVIVHVQVGGES